MKSWEYRGFTMKWSKSRESFVLYNRDGEYEWEESIPEICREWIDSYYDDEEEEIV